jgi:hypothetical protein
MDLRKKLGLLILENEKESVGLMRIALDQARRTEVRQASQRKFSKPKKEPKPPKPKKEKKQRKPRNAKKKKAGMDTSNPEHT